MKVLAIETSCDDTSLAIVEWIDGQVVCRTIVAYHQVDLHTMYGGVVPELASREHLHQMIPVLQQLVTNGGYESLDSMMQDIDVIGVTASPWLPGSLIMGRTLGLFLSLRYVKDLEYINHLDGHIFSFLLDRWQYWQSSTVVISLSGWHSDCNLLSIDGWQYWQSLSIHQVGKFRITKYGTTRDDAIGEVFDKVARLLWGPYPWGPWLSQQAQKHNAESLLAQYPFAVHTFKRIRLLDTYDSSFSGLKSQAYTFIQDYKKQLGLTEDEVLPEQIVSHLAYEFQEASTDIVLAMIQQMIAHHPIDAVALVGGVSANLRLRQKIQHYLDSVVRDTGQNIVFYTPVSFDYCTDNAAMIGMVTCVKRGYC